MKEENQQMTYDLSGVWIGEIKNSYPIWVYPKVQPYRKESNVYETEHFDENAKQVLEQGGTVYLTPPSTEEALPDSIQAQFTTDFWSVGTFPGQEGAMGQLIDEKHPLFQYFPTEFHTNWQWWPMAQLLECRCLNGKLLFFSMGIQNLQQYPECRALLHAIYYYLDSEEFAPNQQIAPEVFEGLVR